VSAALLYVLDANVFIEAAKRYYAFDLVPAFWEHLVTRGNSGHLCTIDRIADEIKEDGLLKAWFDGQFAGCVRQSGTEEALVQYATLMQWSQGDTTFTDAAKAEFAAVADAWLIAYAKAVGGTVVTHETYDANIRRRIKIPNACRQLGVQCVDTFAMLRTLGVRLS
jgi:uncharacterized protein DUF4411